DPEQSEAWKRVTSRDDEERMPPAVSHKRPLSPEEQALFREWIAEGAEYEPHWAFVPPTRPDAPVVKDSEWCRNQIDRFIRSRLEQEGLPRSPDVERPTFPRRVFLDRTGLPPAPAELDEFLADQRPDAYERWVDRVLTEEPYKSRHAERMAGPWMDQA